MQIGVPLSVTGRGAPAPFYPDATLALDFVSSAYRVGSGGSAAPDFTSLPGLTVTRASTGYDLAGTIQFASGVARIVPGFGVLVEEARTNLFLNSFAPVTQTVTITAVSHTITVWGTGSVTVAAGTATISNAGSAAAGSPRTIGCTVAGTITVTVSGSPSIVQVEAGAFGTSPISTAGASATRAADVLSIGSLTFTGDPLTFYGEEQGGGSAAGAFAELSNGTTNNRLTLGLPSTTSVSSFSITAGTSSGSTFATGLSSPIKAALSSQTGSARASANGGAAVSISTGAVPVGTLTTLRLGSSVGGGTPINGYLRKVVIYPTAFSDAQLQAATQ